MDSPQPVSDSAAASRRHWRWWLWIPLGLLALSLAAFAFVFLALRREPDFYSRTRAQLADAQTRAAAAEEFNARAEEFERAVETRPDWTVEFTEIEINAWLLDEVSRQSGDNDSLVSDPLVDLQQEALLIGLRLGTGEFRGVASLEVRPSLPTESQLLLEFGKLRLGALPVPVHRWLPEIKSAIEQQRWPVEFVSDAPLRVRVDLPEIHPEGRRLTLTELTITDESIRIGGRSQPR